MGTTIALVIVGVVVVLVVFLVRGGKPEPFAKGIAKAQRAAHTALRKRHPDMHNDDLYTLVIATRPGYSEQEARSIVLSAKGDKPDPSKSNYFQMVVYMLVCHEYRKRSGSYPGPDLIGTFISAVHDVIPDEL